MSKRLLAAAQVAATTGGSATDRIVNDPRVPSLRPYGLNLPFEIGPAWKMYQLSGVADRDYAPGQLNAALHIDAAKQVLDLGPVFVLDYGQATQ